MLKLYFEYNFLVAVTGKNKFIPNEFQITIIIPFDTQKSIHVQMKHGTLQRLIQFGEN